MSLVNNEFLLENGTGLAGATSYLSILEADTYNLNVGISADWNSYEANKKQVLLNKASLFLTNNYYFIYKKLKETQGLAFPRVEEFKEDIIIFPDNIKYATMELAILLDEKQIFITTQQSERLVTMQKVGPLTTQYENDVKDYEYRNRSRQNKLEFIDKLLKDYINNESIRLR